jgi:DNA-binding GntR family transcriptional regulator
VIAERIRFGLLRGEFAPDLVYTAPSLAVRYGVSVTPVREAILDLANEGLVSIRRNKGFSVAVPTLKGVQDIAEVRRLIEVPATVAITERLTVTHLRHLLRAAEETVTHARDGDLVAYVTADRAFHLAVLELSGNPVLVELCERLRTQARAHAYPFLLTSGSLLASAQEHVDLVRSMQTRDVTAVARIVDGHIAHALRELAPDGSVRSS